MADKYLGEETREAIVKIRSSYKMLGFLPMLAGMIIAFQNCSRVAFTQADLGSLSDPSTSCTVNPNAPGCVNPQVKCNFNGQEYSEGQTVIAYLASSVPSGQTCKSEVRTCSNGAFSGSYQYANCVVNAPSACLFNGQTITHNSSVIAYQSSSVPYGSTCTSESRICNNGELSGSFSYATCDVNAPSACLFNGQTVAHGNTVKAYQGSSVAFGSTCVSEDRTCNNGTLSGSYSYGSCNVNAPASCLFNGQTIAHAGTVKAYQNSSVAYGSTCVSEDRTCNNGTLSGSYSYGSCNVNAPASCLFDGQTVAHGATVKAYQTSSVAYGSTCSSQDRTCNNGTLSGSYSYGSCNVNAPASCLFNGQTVAHGSTVKGYQAATVPYGSTCASQDRLCTNGTLSGTYGYGSCSVNAPASCTFNGQTVAHGSSVTAYQSSTVISGSGSCVSQVRTCSNGSLSGTYTAPSCTVTCSPNYGQYCEKSSNYYYSGPRFKSSTECLIYSGNAGMPDPCPAPSPGYVFAFKTCSTDYAPTIVGSTVYWYATFQCAQMQVGTYSCSGVCQ